MWDFRLFGQSVRFDRTVGYNALAVLFLLITGWILLTDDNWTATGRGGVSFIVAALCAFFGNLDRIESFKASVQGVEGKTRELVERTETALEVVRKLGLELGKNLIEVSASGGRFGGEGMNEKDRRKQSIIGIMKNIGLNKSELDELEKADEKWVIIDYINIIGSVSQKFSFDNTEKTNTIGRMINEYSAPFFRGETEPPDGEIIRREISEILGEAPKIVNDIISSYEHYRKSGQHKHPKLWAQRDHLFGGPMKELPAIDY